MSTFYVLSLVLAGALGLTVLSAWLRLLTQERQEEDADPPEQPVAASDPPMPQSPPSVPEIPEHERPGYWFRTLLRPLGVMGALALAIQPVILWVNTFLLSRTLSIIYDIVPESIANVSIWGIQREISLFDAFALTVSLGQMLLAAVAAYGWEHYRQSRFLAWFSSCAWMVLATYEVEASVYRSLITGESLREAVLSGIVALGVVMLEAVCGSLVFERFITPLLLAFFWTLGAPVRGLARMLQSVGARLRRSAPVPVRRAPAGGLPPFVRALDSLFEPVRDLDRTVYDPLVARLTARRRVPRAVVPALALLLICPPFARGAHISRPAQQRPIDWYVCFDESKSVPEAEFEAYKSNLFPQLVMGHLKQMDSMFVMTIDRNPQERVEYECLDKGRFTQAVSAFYRDKVMPLKQTSFSRRTDYGAVLAFVSRSVAGRQDYRTKPLPIVVLFTDGEPDGPQTAISGQLPPEVKLYFFGVHAKNESALVNYLRRVKIPASQVEIVPFAGWQGWSGGFSQKLGRMPNQNTFRTLSAR